MATSGSVDYTDTTDVIIKDALLLCGGVEDNETPSADQTNHAMRSLNRMCKAWSAKGLKAWLEESYTLDLEADTASYTLSINRPLRIYDVRKVVNSVETPVRIVTRNEYMSQPAKDSTGKPVFVYYDPDYGDGVLYVWPTPDSSDDDLRLTYKSYIEDFDTTANDAHFPSEWLEALVYNLAVRLAPRYEVAGQELLELKAQAAQYLMDAEDADMEEGSLYIEPEYQY